MESTLNYTLDNSGQLLLADFERPVLCPIQPPRPMQVEGPITSLNKGPQIQLVNAACSINCALFDMSEGANGQVYFRQLCGCGQWRRIVQKEAEAATDGDAKLIKM